jgi:hypothetical protein
VVVRLSDTTLRTCRKLSRKNDNVALSKLVAFHDYVFDTEDKHLYNCIMSTDLEILSLEVHISLLEAIVKNLQRMSEFSVDPIRRKEYAEEAGEVRDEIVSIANKIEQLRRENV